MRPAIRRSSSCVLLSQKDFINAFLADKLYHTNAFPSLLCSNYVGIFIDIKARNSTSRYRQLIRLCPLWRETIPIFEKISIFFSNRYRFLFSNRYRQLIRSCPFCRKSTCRGSRRQTPSRATTASTAARSCHREKICIEIMTSDRTLEASREGRK